MANQRRGCSRPGRGSQSQHRCHVYQRRCHGDTLTMCSSTLPFNTPEHRRMLPFSWLFTQLWLLPALLPPFLPWKSVLKVQGTSCRWGRGGMRRSGRGSWLRGRGTWHSGFLLILTRMHAQTKNYQHYTLLVIAGRQRYGRSNNVPVMSKFYFLRSDKNS